MVITDYRVDIIYKNCINNIRAFDHPEKERPKQEIMQSN